MNCSAKTGKNVDLLLSVITKMLPEGPRLYDSEYMTDQTERVIAAELIREQLLHYTDQEIPHGTAVIITEFKEKNDDGEITDGDDRSIAVIKADIICSRAYRRRHTQSRRYGRSNRRHTPAGQSDQR